MNPTQVNPLDYLNQIAPSEQKAPRLGSFKPVHFIAAGLIALLLLILVIGLVTKAAGGPTANMEHLAARLQATAKIAAAADPNIKSGKLAALNSNLDIFLTNTNRDIAAPFKEVGVDTAHLSKAMITSEAGTQLSARLDDARLNAVFDSTYAREMAYQLATILTLMKEVYKVTGNTDVKNFLENAYTNLEPTQQSFDSFSATTE